MPGRYARAERLPGAAGCRQWFTLVILQAVPQKLNSSHRRNTGRLTANHSHSAAPAKKNSTSAGAFLASQPSSAAFRRRRAGSFSSRRPFSRAAWPPASARAYSAQPPGRRSPAMPHRVSHTPAPASSPSGNSPALRPVRRASARLASAVSTSANSPSKTETTLMGRRASFPESTVVACKHRNHAGS